MRRSVVLIGTFRKEREKLERTYEVLSSTYEVLSPKSIAFVDPDVEFVKASFEMRDDVSTIEGRVLDAIKSADFVWLFAPSGYVGVSASFEIGYAYSLGIPVFTNERPTDPVINTMITKIVRKIESVPSNIHRPGKGIEGLQSYYDRISKLRGWDKESPRDTMLLLTEEIGELARSIRKSEGLSRDAGYSDVSLRDELADVQLYLVHLANSLDVSLADAVTRKEVKNDARNKNKNDKN